MRLIHKNGLALVEAWEGLFLQAYRDIAGVWTIGWGHTGGVYKGQQITRMEAEQLLTLDLADASSEVDARCPNATDDQFDALTSFTFNEGKGALRSSTLLRKFKAGDIEGAADQFLVWDKAHVDGQLVVVQGLLNRRRAERSLFLGMPQLASRAEIVHYHAGRRGLRELNTTLAELPAGAWRGMESAPEGECVQLIAFAHVDWIFATFWNGWWEDANGSPVQALAWRPKDA